MGKPWGNYGEMGFLATRMGLIMGLSYVIMGLIMGFFSQHGINHGIIIGKCYITNMGLIMGLIMINLVLFR